MILADWEIEREIQIDPFVTDMQEAGVISYGLGSFGYDFRLGFSFKVFRGPSHPVFQADAARGLPVPCAIDPKRFDPRLVDDLHVQPGEAVAVPANGFALAETLEIVSMPDNVHGIVLGKSSYARVGLIVNCTPIEAAWRGRITIELSNSTPLPILVYPGEGIMQLCFFRGARPRCTYAERKGGGKYQDQKGLTLPSVAAALPL